MDMVSIVFNYVYNFPSTCCVPNYSEETWKYIFLFYFFFEITQIIEAFLVYIVHCQYHGCWWPGDTRSQCIINHKIIPRNIPTTRKVNHYCVSNCYPLQVFLNCGHIIWYLIISIFEIWKMTPTFYDIFIFQIFYKKISIFMKWSHAACHPQPSLGLLSGDRTTLCSISIVSATRLKIGHPQMKSAGARSSNGLNCLDIKIDHHASSPSNGRLGDMPYLPMSSG